MKRKDRKKVSGGSQHADGAFIGRHYPQLAEFLTTASFDDGGKREAPTLTIWCGGGLWRATLKDRTEGLVMWLSAEQPLELLSLIEQYCLEEDGPWRVDDYSDSRGKRKKGL